MSRLSAIMYVRTVTIFASSPSWPSLRHPRNGRRTGLRFRSVGFAAALALLSVSLPPQWASAATIDGSFDQTGPVSGGQVFNLTVLGRGGVPASGVGSVALNVTVTRPTAASFVTVWPAGQSRPNASNLNFTPGQTVPNMVIVPVGAGGQISIFNETGTTDVLVDVLGWFPVGPSFTGLTPARLMDSRIPTGGTTDGAVSGIGPLAGGLVFNLPVAGRGGVPASGVGSVALNVTVARPTAASFVTVWPAGQSRPNASNLNFTPGQTVPNMVIVPVGAGGQISIFNETGTTDVLVDVLGWFPVGPSFTGLTPARLMDSRIPTGGTTDGAVSGIGPLAGGQVFNLPVAGRGGVPASGVGSVALNVTVARPTAASFVTVWPAGQSRPNASNLNFTPGQTVPNMVIVPVGAGGQVSIANETGSTDVLVDVLGWFPVGPSFTGLTPARLMDSRIPPPPPPAAVLTFTAGTHVVNSSIPPGRYLAQNAASGCYWERLSGFSGTLDDVLANDFRGFPGPAIVDVLPTDLAFKFDADCGTFKTYTAPPAPSATIAPGAHVVGANIVSGTYAANAAAGCYWERVTSFDGTLSAVIANDFISSAGTQIVTINPSDVGFSTDDDCGTWTRI